MNLIDDNFKTDNSMAAECLNKKRYDKSGEYELAEHGIIKTIYNKDDIKMLLTCENDKALRFLKVLYQMKYAIKIGKEYYVKAEDFEKFINQHLGQEIAI